MLGLPRVCTACIRHFKAVLLLQSVTGAVAETNCLAGQQQRASLHYFRSPGLFFTLFWGTCAALAQGLHSFIPFLLFSFLPLPPTQHCQQLWGQACPCRRRFARSSAFSLTLPPSAVLRVRAKTNALFPLVTLRANYPVKQWFTRNVWSRWYKSLLSAKNPYLVTQKPFISCWYQFLYSNFRRNLTEFLQAGSRFAICCAVAVITNVKQPRQQWVVPLFLPAHCEKESKDGFCHRRLIKDAVALHNVNYLYSVQNFLLCSCFIQL